MQPLNKAYDIMPGVFLGDRVTVPTKEPLFPGVNMEAFFSAALGARAFVFVRRSSPQLRVLLGQGQQVNSFRCLDLLVAYFVGSGEYAHGVVLCCNSVPCSLLFHLFPSLQVQKICIEQMGKG